MTWTPRTTANGGESNLAEDEYIRAHMHWTHTPKWRLWLRWQRWMEMKLWLDALSKAVEQEMGYG